MRNRELCIRIEIILDPGESDGSYVVTLETGLDDESKPRWRGQLTGTIDECINASVGAWTDMQVSGAILDSPIKTNLRGHVDICEGEDAQHFFRAVATGIHEVDPTGVATLGGEMFGRTQ